MEEQGSFLEPHVLIFPLPAQGPLNSMLNLAELLALSGIHITFLNSEFNHRRLLLHNTDIIQQLLSRYPNKFRFETIVDGLPDEHPRSGKRFMEIIDSMKVKTKPLFRELLISSGSSSSSSSNHVSSCGTPPVSCVIADGILSFAVDVAKEIGLPCVAFRTISACYFWVYFCIPKLIQAGKVPIKGDANMDELVTSVPGTESFLRLRDLPSFCRGNDLSNPSLQLITTETPNTPNADAHILNTFEDLEGPILSLIRSHFPKLYTIGPLHAHLKSKLGPEMTSSSGPPNSLWEIDRSCMMWLNTQPLNSSVIYVSFGSLTTLTRDQLIEFWYGLVNSKKPFLWVIRPNSIIGEDGDIPVELVEGTKRRGYVVDWAPQEEVLAHPAVGGFLTHSGWNSTLESILVGKPMICWPYFVDQQVNSRFVSEVWKVGMDMKDTCDRVIVETMVNHLMEVRRDEFVASANHMAELARKCLSQGGSSFSHFNRLIEDIRLMSLQSQIPNN